MSNHWKTNKERGSYFGINLLLIIFKVFGAAFCKIILSPVLLYFLLTHKEARNSINLFYKLLAKESNKTYITLYSLTNFFNFGYGVIDRLAVWVNRFPTNKVHSRNSDRLYEMAAQKKGGILIVSHLGNFELCRAVASKRLPIKMNIIVDMSNAKKMYSIMKKINADFSAELIPVEQVDIGLAIKLQEKIEVGEFIVIAGDRTTSPSNNNSMLAQFLGEPAYFPIGPYILAKVLKCPVFMMFCLKQKGQYQVFLEHFSEHISFNRQTRENILRNCTQHYANILEKYAKMAPSQWYNFYNFWQ